MKLTFKEKAKLFWERNKADILGWLVAAGIIGGFGCIAAYKVKKDEEGRQTLEEAVRLMAEQKRKEEAEAARAEEERIKNDPNNQMAGGYFRPDNDDLCNSEYPSILVNTVPVANMGELGEEVLKKLNEEQFGEFLETGAAIPFDPATATVDVMIDFGHEVWKRNHSEEEESQEKQAS